MFESLNYIEAVFWAIVGLAFLIRSLSRTNRQRLQSLIAAGAFILFGASDVVEAQTGAWWRPWWLLAWKAACLVVLACLLTGHVRRRRILREPDDTTPGAGSGPARTDDG